MQALIIGHHQVTLIPQIILVGIGKGLDIDVVGAGGRGTGHYLQSNTADLFHICLHVGGRLLQAYAGGVIEHDFGVGGKGKVPLVAVPLLYGWNNLRLIIGLGYRGEPGGRIAVTVVGDSHRHVLFRVVFLIALLAEAKQQSDIPGPDVPLTDHAVVAYHILQLAAPDDQGSALLSLRKGDGFICFARVGHRNAGQDLLHIQRRMAGGIGAQHLDLRDIHVMSAGGLGIGLGDVHPQIATHRICAQGRIGRCGNGVSVGRGISNILVRTIGHKGVGGRPVHGGHCFPGVFHLRGIGGLDLIVHGPHFGFVGNADFLQSRPRGSKVDLDPLMGLLRIVLGIVINSEVLQIT